MKTRFDIRLIAMDLDGTLLTTDKRLTERNRSAMKKAAEAGIAVVPATGRIYAGVPDEIKALPFIRYLILANGATVYDREEDRILYRAEIPPDKAIDVLDWLDGFPAIYDCYQDNQGYMTAEMWDKADRYAPSPIYLRMIRTLRKPVPDLKEYLHAAGRPVQKLQAPGLPREHGRYGRSKKYAGHRHVQPRDRCFCDDCRHISYSSLMLLQWLTS